MNRHMIYQSEHCTNDTLLNDLWGLFCGFDTVKIVAGRLGGDSGLKFRCSKPLVGHRMLFCVRHSNQVVFDFARRIRPS